MDPAVMVGKTSSGHEDETGSGANAVGDEQEEYDRTEGAGERRGQDEEEPGLGNDDDDKEDEEAADDSDDEESHSQTTEVLDEKWFVDIIRRHQRTRLMWMTLLAKFWFRCGLERKRELERQRLESERLRSEIQTLLSFCEARGYDLTGCFDEPSVKTIATTATTTTTTTTMKTKKKMEKIRKQPHRAAKDRARNSIKSIS